MRQRVAVIGGMNFPLDATNDALRKVASKYPDAVFVTGNGRGAEAHVKEFVGLLGMAVEVPPLHEEWYGKLASDCQVDDILMQTGPIMLVGSGGRVKRAEDWIKRVDAWRDSPRPVWRLQSPAKPKPKHTTAPRKRRGAADS